MNKPIRHGENLLVPVESFYGDAKKSRAYIVGHRETGHHHILESKTYFDVAVSNEDLYLRLYAPADLVHKKSHDRHDTLTVQPGIYRVKRKHEYDPWSQRIREVFD